MLDLVGKKYNRLTILQFEGLSKQGSLWKCKCDCGNVIITVGKFIKSGASKSCGCLKIEKLIERSTTHSHTKGKRYTQEYNAWCHLKSRCYNKNVHNYKNYGGRGIKVCERWLNSFENFLEDMGLKPSHNHSIDRFPNVNGDYEPSNCRWGTDEEQRRCRTDNRWIEFDGTKMILTDWAKYLTIDIRKLHKYLKRHTIKEAISFYKNKN